MSFLSVLLYIVHGTSLRRGYEMRKPPDDAIYLELFSRILVGRDGCPHQLLAALEQGINVAWEDVYDVVNPYGDRRGNAFESVWTFDLDKGLVFLTKNDQHSSASLGLARERLLTLDDFVPVDIVRQPLQADQDIPGLYWEPEFDYMPREISFLGRIIRDFGHTWRHVLCREINTTTFMKLAYAIIWISKMEFTLLERVGFEHISQGGPYVKVIDLPSWDTPDANLVPAGSSWFVLTQDIYKGLELVRGHAARQALHGRSTTESIKYAVLTLRQVVLCKASGKCLSWTRPEKLFHDSPATDAAISMILTISAIERKPLTINTLPVEIQDKILRQATVSLVASSKLGCELGIGSPFSWIERGVPIGIQERKTHRSERSPVESQLVFNGVGSGLSYKRDGSSQTPISSIQTLGSVSILLPSPGYIH
ncbi:uncharacterized protein F5Z01DRAFT_279938 [Emericellopsis atlantica]|uniref:Uncharacterized protein n=1 Tax=Emericellopsis atlantica TaxID=2614577 RepID=A0A9P7ZH19_9HYPO|nr:uncharacterized protein F5Z01DRAFT_279938 [Emericellopsis atlantica]KAG9251420.1 hypothetical protein F5Z01DRAFT_279938 [Emericellopsis atlantica]